MTTITSSQHLPAAIRFQPDRFAQTVDDVAAAIIDETERQVATTRIPRDEDAQADFRISCDGLNYWRACWRLREEYATDDLEDLPGRLTRSLCAMRGYDPEEFEAAKHATAERERSPLGLDPLSWAYLRSKRQPIRLLSPELSSSPVATAIASIALQLQTAQGSESVILLPVESLRALLSKKKVVVSGSILRLIAAGLLSPTNARYHTGKAREFKFVGEQGKHFEFVQ